MSVLDEFPAIRANFNATIESDLMTRPLPHPTSTSPMTSQISSARVYTCWHSFFSGRLGPERSAGAWQTPQQMFLGMPAHLYTHAYEDKFPTIRANTRGRHRPTRGH